MFCHHRKGKPARGPHPVAELAGHVFRMQRETGTKTDHDAKQRTVNMEAKGSTRFLKKLEMRADSFMAITERS